jgi:hypothetical protein
MNVPFLKISLVLILLSFSFNFSFSASKPSELTYEEFYKEFTNLQPDESKVCDVSNLFLQLDAGVFSFEEGKLYFFKPLAGRICMAVFKGKGNFAFTPPTKVEKEQLERIYKTPIFDTEFGALFLVFTDSTYHQISQSYVPRTEVDLPETIVKIKERSFDFLVHPRQNHINESITNALLKDNNNDFFYAVIERTSGEPVMWCIEPDTEEEITFQRGVKESANFSYPETINAFHAQNEYNNLTPEELENEDHDQIKIIKEIMDIKIENSLSLKSNIKVIFKPTSNNDKYINFELGRKLDVDSVISSKGENLSFFKGKLGEVLWVRLSEPTIKDSLVEIRICAHGNIIIRSQNITFLLPEGSWYPKYGYWNLTMFDMTFHYPDNYVFACSGDLISTDKKDGVITSRYLVSEPSLHVAFNIGDFRVREVREKDVPPITIYSTQTKQVDWVATDLSQSLRFYNSLYGSIPFKYFYVAEIPFGYGQSFPSFLYLSIGAFLGTGANNYGDHEEFVSHEMAHQWWGGGVNPKSYHDEWISEGLAEYSALMYVQLVMKDNDKFFNLLKRQKKELLENRGFFSKGIAKGPISLGRRNNTSLTEGDYSIVIYKKGAWVMHMLRNLLIDLKSMNEDTYMSIMKDFYSSFVKKTASTRDIRKIFEKNLNKDMSWFFDEWVDGTGIPTYKYAYKYDKQPDGKYKVKLRVKQENVPANFLMYVPVKIDFGDDKFARLRVKVTGEKSEIDLPTMPLEPKEIIFNDLESVLCEVESEKWE